MIFRGKRSWSAAVAAATATGLSSAYPAVAEEPAVGLEEIVVTAQKRIESERDVPISMTVFSSQQLQDYGIEGVQDYMQLTPNVAFFSSGNSTDQKISIRGVTNVGGYVNSLAVYVDEFNVTPGPASSTYEQNLLDLERVEVLRGPQGITFGRNVIGGAVSMTTKKPRRDFEAEASGEYGSYGTWMARGMLNVPVSDTVAVRANAYWRESDGFIRDVGPGGSRNDYEGKGARVAVRFLPTDSLTIDLAASRTQFDQGINDFVPSGVLLESLIPLGFSQPIDDGEGFYPHNRDRVATDTPVTSANDTDIATARLEWNLGDFSLVSVSGFIDNDNGYQGDGDMTARSYYVDDITGGLQSYSTELRLQSNGKGRWSWVAGALYAHDTNSNVTVRDLNSAFMALLHLTGTRRVVDQYTSSSAKSYALFGDLTWRSDSQRLAVSMGARYTHDQEFNHFFDNSENIVSGVPLGNESQGSESFSDVSPRVSVVYSLSPETNVYGTVSKGFKSGGFNFGVNQIPTISPKFGKETAWNYESGIKSSFFDNRLRADLAVFYMKWDDIQVRTGYIGPNLVPIQFIQNAASATSKGVELALKARPLPAVDLEMNAGYDKARFDDFPGALNLFGTAFDASGHPLLLAPEWSASAAAQYNIPMAASFTAFIRGEYSYRDEFFNDPEQLETVGHFVPAYDVWNLRIGFENDNYRVTAYAENLLDDDHYVGSRRTQFLSGNAVVLDPRRVGVQFTAKFY
jgi:iron complex outermembrane receptor protein